MNPTSLGKKYDKIADWWQSQHDRSNYGVDQIRNALNHRNAGSRALDVGCGAGGRFVRILQKEGYMITGLDVSSKMIKLAINNHPDEYFVHQDICTWDSIDKFDFILAWDSIFHLPYHEQRPIVAKLCKLLDNDGVLIYTFGNAIGEHTDEWHGDTFYYSSIGINENIRLLMENGLTVLHLELDQHPENHGYVVAKKS